MNMSVQGTGGLNNGFVPNFQEGGGVSKEAIDKMGNDELINLAQKGSPIDKQNAMNELMERLGANKTGESGGGGGGGGGIEGVDDELKKILQKLMNGESLSADEVKKLVQALGNAENNV